MFDPYEKWLGIPADQRPITYFMLLGISPKEKSPQAIADAAEAQAELVSQHQDGPRAQACARLLKEIEQAAAVLADPARRKAYDARLRKENPETATTAAVPAPASKKAVNGKAKKGSAKKGKAKEKDKKPTPVWLWATLGGVAALLLIGGGVTAFLLSGSPKEPTNQIASGPPTPPPPLPEPTKPEPKPEPPKPEPPKPEPPMPEPPKPEPPKPPPPPTGCLQPAPHQPTEVVKMPVPDQAAQARAEAALKETYKADYAKTTPDEKLALAAKLLQPGRENRDDPTAWFVLLREARDLSVAADRPRLAVEAVIEMDKWFMIPSLDMKMKVLTSVAQGSSATAASAARTALGLLPQAYSEDNFDAARRLVEYAEAAAKKSTQKKLIEYVDEQKSEVEFYTAQFQDVVKARAKLMQNPDDGSANLTVGKYLCFFQADWDKGLPLLAKSSDRGLKNLAEKDLSQPADIKTKMFIADEWYNIGIKDRVRVQRNLLKRAKMWYGKVGPDVTGKDRDHVVARIQDAQQREDARIAVLLPGSYYGRDPETRVLLLREGGGTMQSEEAVERGLEWLAKHQGAGGMWSNDTFSVTGRCNCGDPGEKHDIAGTAFGLLPFLGAGNTHLRGKYASVVQKGVTYLLQQQKEGGNFHDNAYENALATIVVVEDYGLTRDQRVGLAAQRAVNYIVRAQSSDGSWGYSAGAAKGDTSISGWQFTALKAAVYAGLEVPQETFTKLSRYLDTVSHPQGLGYGYNAPDAAPAPSAVGVLCRLFLNWGPGHPGLIKAAEHLLRPNNHPTKERISIYTVFYITQVAHHLGGTCWEKWNGTVRDLLIELQDKGTGLGMAHQKGSFSPLGDPFAKQGGRLMFTSLSLITLETYYYHIPLYGYGPAVVMD